MTEQQHNGWLDSYDPYPLRPKIRMKERPFEGWPEKLPLSLAEAASKKLRRGSFR